MKQSTQIESELRQIEGMLERLDASAFLERLTLENRKEELITILKTLGPEPVSRKTIITFRGEPVLGSKGISADFAGKATSALMNAYQAIVAGLNSTLRYMGPIPDRADHDLKIVGTAVGSFGFEFELPLLELDLFGEPHSYEEEAIESLQELLRVSSVGTDDEVDEIIEKIHPRAVRKVHDFLEVLEQNHAWCGLEFKGEIFRFKDFEEVEKSSKRLSLESLSERDEKYTGEFQGVLPKSRNFEFLVHEDEFVIRGKLSDEIEDPDEINRSLLHKTVTATFRVTQFGQARPRYLLTSLPNAPKPN